MLNEWICSSSMIIINFSFLHAPSWSIKFYSLIIIVKIILVHLSTRNPFSIFNFHEVPFFKSLLENASKWQNFRQFFFWGASSLYSAYIIKICSFAFSFFSLCTYSFISSTILQKWKREKFSQKLLIKKSSINVFFTYFTVQFIPTPN